MTRTFKTGLRLTLAGMIVTFALVGCNYQDNVVSQELIVKTMADSMSPHLTPPSDESLILRQSRQASLTQDGIEFRETIENP